jgi:hypothetical protein
MRQTNRVWCDKAPAHSSRYVIWYLDRYYPKSSAADSHSWGHVNSTVYAQQYNTRDEAWNVTQVAGMMLCNMADIIQQTQNS